jgi:hypothetical protein
MDVHFRKELEGLLGPPPDNPWAALLPQILMWSFRRFCILKITNSFEDTLAENIWSDLGELVTNYAPKGLEGLAAMQPERCEKLYSPLTAYNDLMLDIVDWIDKILDEDLDEEQVELSRFLDEMLRDVFLGWLTGYQRMYYIFPLNEEYEDEFAETRVYSLVTKLLTFTNVVPLPVAVVEPLPVVKQETETETQEEKEQEQEQEKEQTETQEQQEPETQEQEPALVAEIKTTVKAALLHRRLTRRHRGTTTNKAAKYTRRRSVK